MKKFNFSLIVVVLVLACAAFLTPNAHALRLFGDAWRVDAGVLSCSSTNGSIVLTNVTIVGGTFSNKVVGGTVSGSVVTNCSIRNSTLTGTLTGGTLTGSIVSNSSIYIGSTAAVKTNLSLIDQATGATNTFKVIIVP